MAWIRQSVARLAALGLVAHAAVAAAGPAHPTVGLLTDLGVPDGAGASLALRPVRALRVELGVAHNGVCPGVRGGLTWIPLSSWATPVIAVGYGRFFERDANPLVRVATGDAAFSSPLLDRVGYDFAVARAGLELGRRHVTFFVHAGVTEVTGTIHQLAALSNQQAMQAGSQVTVTSTDPHVQILSVSADLGLVVYLH